MASLSSSSGLYRTTSASSVASSSKLEHTATSNSDSLPLSSGKTNTSIDHGVRESACQSSLQPTAFATDGKKTRKPRMNGAKKKELRELRQTSVSSVKGPLVGFVPATSLTKDRSSKVATPTDDRKGKGRAMDDASYFPEDRETSDALNSPAAVAQESVETKSHSVETDDDGYLQPSQVDLYDDKPSPGESAASSTDDLPYVPSATASPQVTPHKSKTVPPPAQTSSTSKTIRPSPFQPFVTGFDLLAALNKINPPLPTEEVVQSSYSAPSTAGLGIGGPGLASLPSQQTLPLPSPDVPQITSQPSPNPDGSARKRVAASPLTWSNNHKALDAPTLGSPTLGSMQEDTTEEEVISHAITKASYAASRDTILQELANRKLLLKQELQARSRQEASNEYHTEAARRVRSRSRDRNEIDGALRSPGSPKHRHRSLSPDHIKRRDMAEPRAIPGTNSRQQDEVDGMLHGMSLTDSVRSLENGMTSTTTVADEEADFDDAASHSSMTSAIIRSVARDSDNRGWGDVKDAPRARVQARRRLQDAILKLNERHRPSRATLETRQRMLTHILQHLNSSLSEWGPNQKYQLKPFGSTAYGLDTDTSDLDLCIIDPKRPQGFRNAADLYPIDEGRGARLSEEKLATTEEDEANRLSTPFGRRKGKQSAKLAAPLPEEHRVTLGKVLGKLYDVRRLGDMLRKMGYDHVEPIVGATVPIVKFVSPEGIKADMNTNEQLGVRNSALLAEYVSFSPIVRPFLIFLKVWAKQRSLNDPSGRRGLISMSSYSLVLMAIAYLQHAGIVPNLQDPELIRKHGVARDIFWMRIPNRAGRKVPHGKKRNQPGDYRAMAIDTTFIRVNLLDAEERAKYTVPSHAALAKNGNPLPGVKKDKMGPVGWESDTDARPSSPNGWKAGSQEEADTAPLLELIEGFFEYYSGFPLDQKAVSIWRGKPLIRTTSFQPATVPELKYTRRLAREAAEAEEAERLSVGSAGSGPDEVMGKITNGPSEPSSESGASTITSDEELRNLLDRSDARLKQLGVENAPPSFEDTLKERVETKVTKKERKHIKRAAKAAAISTEPESSDETETKEPRMREVRKLASSNLYNGLDLSEANKRTLLFPIPPVENADTFVDPPAWIQKLIVQDPFIHSRNTCANISYQMVEQIWKEMHRALEMVNAGAPLQDICINVRHDPAYQPLAGKARPDYDAERAERTKIVREKKRLNHERHIERQRAIGAKLKRQAADKKASAKAQLVNSQATLLAQLGPSSQFVEQSAEAGVDPV